MHAGRVLEVAAGRARAIAVAVALFAVGCGGQQTNDALGRTSTCGDIRKLKDSEREQAILRLSKEVGAEHAGNPLWLEQIAAECAARSRERLGVVFERGATAFDDAGVTEAGTPEPSAFRPARTYRWDVEGETGSTAEVVVELGTVARADEAPPEPFAALITACDQADAQRDAFLPLRLTARNTTEGFDLSPSVTLRLHNVVDRFEARLAVEAATEFTDGSQCDALTSGSIDDGTGVSFDGLQPDEGRDHDVLLMLRDYFSPADPQGDDAALKEWFGTLLVRDDTSTLHTQCFDAPPDRYAHTGGFIALGGALSPAVPLADAPVSRSEDGNDSPPLCGDAEQGADAQSSPCHELASGARVVTSRGRFGVERRTHNRVASVAQVCDGFGSPEGLELTPGMQCALVAGAASYAGFPSNQGVRRACDVLGIRKALQDGSWAGEASGQACGFFAQAFAGATGVVAAGATSATGPGAAAVGLGTYKAFSAGLTVACGGLFDGGAEALGHKLESDHQRNVAIDILRNDKCLREERLRGLIRWSAAECP